MKILVSGSLGFIGSHLTDLLIEQGHDVVGIDNLWDKGGGRIENKNPKAKYYIEDIYHYDMMEKVFAIEKPEIVYHLAAQHSVKISTDMPVLDARVNIIGLINTLKCCTLHEVKKIIFSSSGATYGTVEDLPVNEETPQNPESPYGITKMMSERYLKYWKQTYNLDYTVLRYGNVYGPRQDPTGEAGVIGIFINNILTEKPCRIDWDGEQEKDYVYVKDVAKANLMAMENGGGEAFCIASGMGNSVNTLYALIKEIIKKDNDIIHAPKRAGDIYKTWFDCSKALNVLEWKAETLLSTGLMDTVGWFNVRNLEKASLKCKDWETCPEWDASCPVSGCDKSEGSFGK